METTTIQKLYAIAKTERVTDTYTKWAIEHIRNALSAHAFANKIYKAAMVKYESRLCKRASAADINGSLIDQMACVRAFAKKYGLMDDYAAYIERLVSNREQFDMTHILSLLIDTAITIHDMRLRRKIDADTGITLVGGYRDAV